jgi:hypothetical protein
VGHLVSTGSCPYCLNGNNTPCFAEYSDGYKCFSCGKTKTYSGEYLSWKDVHEPKTNVYIPNATRNIKEFSIGVLSWLYKYYVYDDLIRKYDIMYTTPEGLLFTLSEDFYQQRFFPSKKFITKGSKSCLFTPGDYCGTIVVVEDYISAIRVAEHYSSLCLFGTSINREMVLYLVHSVCNIIVWLDPDEAGKSAAHNIKQTLTKIITKNQEMYAFNTKDLRVEVLITEKQPKEYSPSQINDILKERI